MCVGDERVSVFGTPSSQARIHDRNHVPVSAASGSQCECAVNYRPWRGRNRATVTAFGALLERSGCPASPQRVLSHIQRRTPGGTKAERKRLVRPAPERHVVAEPTRMGHRFVADGWPQDEGCASDRRDSFTRECPAIEVDTACPVAGARVLDWIISQRGSRK